ncbi:MAG: response regulator [Elusimicrobia bacterium]|nr:response regulator [Elusimicrobiota bacterium]
MKNDAWALIVDDNEEMRALFSLGVESLGYRAHVAENTASARAWLAEHEPAIILLDVMMPDGNGLDLCRWIRSQRRIERVPVLMTSALKDAETVQDALELGAMDFLQKPFTMAALKEKIQRLRR